METSITCALCESLGSKDGNFIPNTDEATRNHARLHFVQSKMIDDGITEDEVLQRCYMIRQPKIERQTLSYTECRKSLLDLCKSMLKHPENSTAICNVCGEEISTKEMRRMIDHASAHLEVKLFKCRHCDHSLSSSTSLRTHIQREHNVKKSTKEDFEDKTVEYFDEISHWIKRCYSANYPPASGIQRKFIIRTNCRDKTQLSVTHLCRAIFIQRSKPTSLECNLCGLRVTLVSAYRRRLRSTPMFIHAAAHLEVKPFACRHCDLAMSTKASIMKHVKSVHQIIHGNSDDFDDHFEKFRSEYLMMIERCFSTDQVKLEEKSAFRDRKSAIKAETCVLNRANGSQLTVERLLFCNRMIRKFADPDGKVKCSLCSKQLVIKVAGHTKSLTAFSHIEKHLQKPLYRCKVCRSSFNTRPAVSRHLSWHHALGMKNNHECVADEFHEEIMAMLSKCYAPEGL